MCIYVYYTYMHKWFKNWKNREIKQYRIFFREQPLLYAQYPPPRPASPLPSPVTRGVPACVPGVTAWQAAREGSAANGLILLRVASACPESAIQFKTHKAKSAFEFPARMMTSVSRHYDVINPLADGERTPRTDAASTSAVWAVLKTNMMWRKV